VVSRPVRRSIVAVVALAALGVIAAVAYHVYRVALVGAGFAAKNVCSNVFVADRSAEAAFEDLRAYRSTPLDLVSVTVDATRRTATGVLAGVARRTAIHRDGLGCVLAIDANPEALARFALPQAASRPDRPWPEGDADPPPSSGPALAGVLDEAFAERPDAPPRRTRAVVVVHDGTLVAERYAPGFGRTTRLPGWSMTKSVSAALAGVLVAQGRLAIDAPSGLAAWQAPGDVRAAITPAQLLQMSSGLAFDESYGNPLSDVVVMLFGTGDAAAFAAARPLAHPPGTHWAYASGTTNVLMRLLRERIGDEGGYLGFPRRALFEQIGMASAVMETDAAGTFVGSSLMYATARDWARFGLLALNDGRWNGRRVLPEGWIGYMRTPAPAAPEGEYGAHWWLKLQANRGPQARPRQLPADAFHASGHGGQFVTVVPSRRAVIVRLGHAVDRGAWDQDAFGAAVLAALPR
jgi:CubicO group peptidase (beta-lactamase class C family)